MKLVLLTPFYFPSMGGVQETFRLFGEYFVKKGWKVQVHTSQLQGIDDVRIADMRRIRNFMPYQVKDGIEIFRYDGGGLVAAVRGLIYAVSHKLKLPMTADLFRRARRGTRGATSGPKRSCRLLRRASPPVRLWADRRGRSEVS